MFKAMKKSYILVILVVLGACSYSVYTSGFPHLKTISIQTFLNNTVEYDLEEEIQIELTNYFEKDGKLKIVTLSPDCQLEGEILDYSNKIFTYDAAGVEEYELKILFKVIFTDLKKNEIIWKNDALVLSETYSSSEETSEFSTEEEAQKEIYKDLFETIMKNSMEEW